MNETVNIATMPRDDYYNITVHASDTTGNTNNSANITIIIDTLAPNATIERPANNTLHTNILIINASINDTLSKVFNASYRLISPTTTSNWIYAEQFAGDSLAGYWNASFDTNTIADDVYSITINATDFAGNQMLANISQITTSNAVAPTPPAKDTSGSGGGGGGGVIVRKVEEAEEVEEEGITGLDIDASIVIKELTGEGTTTFGLSIVNTLDEIIDVEVTVTGKAAEFIVLKDKLTIEAKESLEIPIFILIPEGTLEGTYSAVITLTSNEQQVNIPVIVNVKKPEVFERLFDIRVEPQTTILYPGEDLTVQIDLINLGRGQERFDIELKLELISIETNETSYLTLETLAVDTSLRIFRTIKLEETESGKHLVKATINYINRGQTLHAISFALITVKEEVEKISFAEIFTTSKFMMPILMLSLILLTVVAHYRGAEVNKIAGQISRYGQREFRRLYIRAPTQITPEKPRIRRKLIRKLVVEKVKPRIRRITPQTLERRKLLNQLIDWKAKGYNTTLLEAELKDIKKRKISGITERKRLLSQLKDWKAKGYNTELLEAELKGFKKSRPSRLEINKLSKKMQNWKAKGYDTKLLEKELKELKNKR